jgi:radical SAM superfamily enzyme YgiQ (UPF0313 family)
MRVTLLNPPFRMDASSHRLGPVSEHLFFNSPPLGLAYIAAVLEREGIVVDLIDAPVERLSLSALIDRIDNFAPDAIGITSTTTFFTNAVAAASLIKKNIEEVPIIIGGNHITANPQVLLDHSCFDLAVLGEGEVTIRELLAALAGAKELEKVKGIAYRKNGKLSVTPPRERIKDLDWLPFPARHLLPIYSYKPMPNDHYRSPKTAMVTSRGCPYRCIFCDHNIYGNLYTSYSARRIVMEMKQLVEVYGIKDIAFVDSLFAISQEKVEGFLEELEKEKIDVTWTCTIRCDTMTKPLLERMKKAGCWRVRIGIESGSEEILKFIKKDIDKKEIKKVVGWADEIGLEPKAFFILGHCLETKATMEESIRFARSIPLKDITVQLNTPLEGTEQFTFYKQYGSLVSEHSDTYSFWQPVFLPRGLTYADLTGAQRRFYRRFYLRPVIWWRHLRTLRRFSGIKKYFSGFKLIFYLFFFKPKKGRSS